MLGEEDGIKVEDCKIANWRLEDGQEGQIWRLPHLNTSKENVLLFDLPPLSFSLFPPKVWESPCPPHHHRLPPSHPARPDPSHSTCSAVPSAGGVGTLSCLLNLAWCRRVSMGALVSGSVIFMHKRVPYAREKA